MAEILTDVGTIGNLKGLGPSGPQSDQGLPVGPWDPTGLAGVNKAL